MKNVKNIIFISLSLFFVFTSEGTHAQIAKVEAKATGVLKKALSEFFENYHPKQHRLKVDNLFNKNTNNSEKNEASPPTPPEIYTQPLYTNFQVPPTVDVLRQIKAYPNSAGGLSFYSLDGVPLGFSVKYVLFEQPVLYNTSGNILNRFYPQTVNLSGSTKEV